MRTTLYVVMYALFFLSLWESFLWFDWKLMVILFQVIWANNIDLYLKKKGIL